MRANNPHDRRRAARVQVKLESDVHRLGHYADGAPTLMRLPAANHRLSAPGLVPDGGCMFNPSVATIRGELKVMIRAYDRDCHQAANIFGRIDDSWTLRDARLTSGWKYEDLRLFECRDKLMAIGYRSDFWRDEPAMVVLDLDGAGDAQAVHVQSGTRHEKNWLPIVRGDELRFVYSVDPLVTIQYDPATGGCGAFSRSEGHARGSSQLLPFDDGFIAVVHEVTHAQNRRWYSHRFARFNADLSSVSMGPHWCFEHSGIEFCAGMAERNGRHVLSYGCRDNEACLAIVEPATVRTLVA